ncbi:MAG: adenosylmethionine decarboxylase [Candidatus Aenigmatarchaeota archaeon]
MFGPHLMLDCYGCNEEMMNDEKVILDFLNGLVDHVKMTKIAEPFIIQFKGNPKTFDNGGVSAMVIIAESHISIHTFPGNGGYLNIDIFSCKDFDVKGAIDFVTSHFAPQKIEKRLLSRGRHFAREEVVPVLNKQRKDLKKRY